jgi:uncharacterized protein YjiS (DUF1127 family)
MIRFWKYIIRWRSHRNVIKELNQLSDRELLDIGFSRSQINNLIWREEDIKKRGEKTRRGPDKLL